MIYGHLSFEPSTWFHQSLGTKGSLIIIESPWQHGQKDLTNIVKEADKKVCYSLSYFLVFTPDGK